MLAMLTHVLLHVRCQFKQELMWRGSDMMLVLRLLVLLSFVGNGLPKKHAGATIRHDTRVLGVAKCAIIIIGCRSHGGISIYI
jgi:hypothetical protein